MRQSIAPPCSDCSGLGWRRIAPVCVNCQQFLHKTMLGFRIILDGNFPFTPTFQTARGSTLWLRCLHFCFGFLFKQGTSISSTCHSLLLARLPTKTACHDKPSTFHCIRQIRLVRGTQCKATLVCILVKSSPNLLQTSGLKYLSQKN